MMDERYEIPVYFTSEGCCQLFDEPRRFIPIETLASIVVNKEMLDDEKSLWREVHLQHPKLAQKYNFRVDLKEVERLRQTI